MNATMPQSPTVHIWYAYVAWLEEPALQRRCLDLLDATERAAYGRFLVPEAQQAYLLAHALCRVALSHHGGCAPTDWRFAPGAQGKPAIVAPQGAPQLHFNLSHSKPMVAVAVSSTHPVGLDVEDARRPIDVSRLASRVLTPRELQACLRHPAPAEHFLRHWTLKEAYLKAQGLGISAGLTHIDMQIDAQALDRAVEVRDGRSGVGQGAWHLRLLSIDAASIVAAAVPAIANANPFVCSDARTLL